MSLLAPSDAKALCHTCQAVLHSFGTAPDGGKLGQSSQQLETRAAQGCRLCALFLGAAKDRVVKEDGTRLYYSFRELEGYGDVFVTYLKRNSYGGYYLLDAKLQLVNRPDITNTATSTLAGLESAILEFTPGHLLLGDSTAFSESLKLARKWIEDCKDSHINCREITGDFRPTRLIDIGETATDTVRLCLGANLVTNAGYFTLSHCWGQKPMPEKLLADNLQSMLVHIDCEKLPRTFQDAIYIVRSLGGRYLWIDSLCIIQDSTEDWQHESSLMGKVYSYGRCNLSALISKDSSVGMIYKRQPMEVFPLQTTFKTADEEQEQQAYMCDPDVWWNGIDQAPLMQRGWACQERLLSSCNLHFGETQIFWECVTRRACEAFPNGYPQVLERLAKKPPVKQIAGELLRSSSGTVPCSLDDPSHPLYLWNLVVELYSRGQLSFGSDKLIALGGLAAISHSKFSNNYLAGLWQEFLPFQLLWHTGYIRKLPPPLTYRAPTWSWAALDTEIYAHVTSSKCVSLIELVGGHVDSVGQSPYGQVKSGYIQIKCYLTPTRLYRSIWLLPLNFKDEIHVPPSWDNQLKPGNKEEIFYFVPVCEGYKPSSENFNLVHNVDLAHGLTGLVIVEVKDRKGYFIRRGMFHLSHGEDKSAREIMRCCRDFGNDSNDLNLKPIDDGSGKFIITII